ncbi:alpha/beta fold hydrolase [Massilia sp. PAMC28688]|uniref:PHA/PHB synthase family protein n=1 Tax=Massilia sp. PAMC28688 TaxID=2861283 RepID=UPI001C6267AE|nr:alpha/beta fold hydrolase [Massilia sp. PAMC28688]QYF92936.1 alpha/beta fold hydrolase [Massilia sp. PAMC28688]
MTASFEQERRKDWQKRRDITALHPEPPEPPTDIDRLLHAFMGQATQGVAPGSLALAGIDWAWHLAQSPGKWQRLLEKAVRKDLRWLHYAARATLGLAAPPCIEPLPQDRRFRGPLWQQWPYNLLQQAFLLNQQWWFNATTGIDGVTRHHEQVVSFVARQLLDLFSPVNFIATNPEVGAAIATEGGANLVRGAVNLLDDLQRRAAGAPPAGSEAFRPGHEVAVTPGRVVFRNRLIELIQYSPATDSVHAAPILIVPAWIMKYYILDLSPHNSLVRFLVENGHTVFMISWHNPGPADRELGMDDYLRDGVMAAIDQVRSIIPGQAINAVGYCLGGTLLAIAAAALGCGESGPGPLKSMTLLAAQTDFSEAGELMLFIDESQIAWLEDLMWQQGYLDNRQMAGAFRLLRSNDLVWSLAVNQYLLGRRAPMTDLMAWNADTTRMPWRMHSDYLRRLFLNNDLFSGRYRVDGRPVALSDMRLPIFAVATISDHVSPWRSVYKLHLMPSCDVQFVLTSGGHNAGIVSEPGHKGRHYYTALRKPGACYLDPDRWLEAAQEREGSWWLAWLDWLQCQDGQAAAAPRAVAPGLGAAPGSYVLER